MKFNSRKPDVKGLGSMKLLKANLTYVTPVIPAQIESIKYGALYNWYAVDDVRNICADGWHVPTVTDIAELFDLSPNEGGKLKETGTTYWISPNTDSTNETGFNGRGSGSRGSDGLFNYLNDQMWFWTSDAYSPAVCCAWILYYNNGNLGSAPSSDNNDKKTGASLRLIKDSTTLTNGQTGTYTGNDGKVYRTICIGTQEWLADNLAETKYRDGSDIPLVTDNAAWAALTTGAMCAYDNDENNV
jgi:uncharacterized protein (TIGR02145 family)